jgi:hypothetical protein
MRWMAALKSPEARKRDEVEIARAREERRGLRRISASSAVAREGEGGARAGVRRTRAGAERRLVAQVAARLATNTGTPAAPQPLDHDAEVLVELREPAPYVSPPYAMRASRTTPPCDSPTRRARSPRPSANRPRGGRARPRSGAAAPS